MVTVGLAAEKDGMVYFEVKDTGIGIAQDKINRLFQDFTQVDTSTAKKYGGTGLGLSLSKRFCEMMGGSIEVKSTEGEGTSFRVLLPLDVNANKPPGASVLVRSAG